MSNLYNLYIDETCHLEHDKQSVMCIGYTKIKHDDYKTIKNDLKKIKLKHKSTTEIKWAKVSMSRLELYKEWIDYFFDHNIDFRCILVKNKKNLDHEKFNRGDHNAFYYKMVYLLLHNKYVNPVDEQYRVILDINDTRGRERLKGLDSSLCYQGEDKAFVYFQHIRSHENELIQLTDLLIGAVGFKASEEHTKPNASKTKCELIDYLEKKSGYSLEEGTIPWESKFNIFDFQINAG